MEIVLLSQAEEDLNYWGRIYVYVFSLRYHYSK